MKCCGSQTISIVPKAIATRSADGAPSGMREAAVAFDALLLGQAFEPLGKAMGFYGDMVVDLAARSVARTLVAGSLAQPSPFEGRP